MATATKQKTVSPTLVLIAAWILPGLGHLLLRRYYRAALLFLSIAGLFFAGLAIAGKIYLANTGDVLDLLGFISNIGNPFLYVIALVAGWGQAPVLTAVAEYGTKFIAAAGLLNVIALADAYALATGRKVDA